MANGSEIAPKLEAMWRDPSARARVRDRRRLEVLRRHDRQQYQDWLKK